MGIKHASSILPVLAAASVLTVTAALPARAATPVPTLQVGGSVTATGFELNGAVQALRQATVAAQISGNVTALLVKAGDRVKAGQALARIDDRDTAAGLQRSEAAVAQADAEWRNARTQVERTRDLKSKGFVSQSALDTAETQLKAAQAALQQAQSARSQAALARGFASVAAPFDGVVLATHLEAGDLATPGRPVATVYAPGAMRAVVQVPASRADTARRASVRQVQLPSGDWVNPVRSTELPVTDPVAQTVEWRLDLAGDVVAQPGQSINVRFDGAPATAKSAATTTLMVPPTAVLRRGELEAVYLVREGHFVLHAVRLGASRGTSGVEVLAGLKAGDRIAQDAVRAGLSDAQPATASR